MAGHRLRMRTLTLQLPGNVSSYAVVSRIRSRLDGQPGEKLGRMPPGYRLLGVLCEENEMVVAYAHPAYRDVVIESYLNVGDKLQGLDITRILENAIKLLER